MWKEGNIMESHLNACYQQCGRKVIEWKHLCDRKKKKKLTSIITVLNITMQAQASIACFSTTNAHSPTCASAVYVRICARVCCAARRSRPTFSLFSSLLFLFCNFLFIQTFIIRRTGRGRRRRVGCFFFGRRF